MRNIRFPSFFLIACMVMLVSCNDNKAALPPPPPKVNVIKIQTASVPVSKSYIGVTSSVANVDIRARVQGFLLSYNFTEGKIVKKGDLLFIIDPEPYKAQVAQAKGQLDQSIANTTFNKIDAQRKITLYKQNAGSEQEADLATTSYQSSLATVEANKANLQTAQINLSYCYIYSPITGMIGQKLVDVGNLVGGTQATVLATVVQLDPIYVSFNPSVNDYAEFLKYKTDKPFKVEVTMPQNQKYKFPGAVDLINNQADINTSTLLMRSVVSNPQSLLLPGKIGRAHV